MNVATAPTCGKLASIAVEALNTLKRPVGFVDSDGRIVFGNEQFVTLFDSEHSGTNLLGRCASADDFDQLANTNVIVNRDGLTFKLEITRFLHGVLVVADDISQQLIDRENAALVARTDPASGLANGLMFRERLTELLQRRDPTNYDAAVLVVSLEKFKAIKTSFGSNTGAALLRLATERLCSTLASGDFLARVGDDEFAILQIHSPQPQSAIALAARLVDLLSRTYLADGHVINTDVSVGVSVIPAGGEDCDKILNNADLALSHARQDGLGRFRLFETAMDAQREARRSLAVDLRRALALRELTLAYQPQFNLGSEHITGFEALLRWRHPKRGFVSPADFIPLAEEIGLIAPIGEWVLRKACREAANWPDSLRVAVNVSAVQFRNTNLCEQVEAALADSGLDPGRLELEITESVLIGDHASVLSALHRLQEMGVRISMDDFGTGYSSLSYLHSFPFDKIKIDQSFVRGAINEASSTAIIRAIAVLGRSLGMTTTAEGVETDAQLNRVREAGCIDVQGYLISRPMPPENIELFLQSRKHSAAAE
jgi:diguanylate cyclase (GGDEF)-like protein